MNNITEDFPANSDILNQDEKPSRVVNRLLLFSIPAGALLLYLAFLIFLIPALQEAAFVSPRISAPDSTYLTSKKYKNELKVARSELNILQNKFRNLTPWNPYLVVNTTDNRFYLYRNRKLIRSGVCSTGSYTLLKSHDKREWLFQTPKGVYTIQGKITSPVWRRPDWSFVEEGLPIPPPNDLSRFEAGVLGDYAMPIGNGYLIHGTIYTRFFGMPVTHGCIRLKDEDLEAAYHTLMIGSKVYIF